MSGQEASSVFHTIQTKSLNGNERNKLQKERSDTLPVFNERNEGDFSMLSESQLEELIALYEDYLQTRKQRMWKAMPERKNDVILQYYKGPSHPLTLNTLLSVINEVGVSHPLIVLAQAVLETGHFKSRICREYNNLFGLYDSRRKDFYRFSRWEDSVIGYIRLVQYKYKGGDYLEFLRRLPYAEGARYTEKVAMIAKQLNNSLAKRGEESSFQ